MGRSGETVPAIGVGTYGIRDYRKAEEALVRAVELGLNMIDTAEMYGSGRAEVLVGRVARSVGRDRVFITTKHLPHHFSDEARALSAAKSSLRRLGVMYADLVLIHWPNAVIPIHRQVRALEAIAREGLARYVGVSNFEEGELEEALMSTARYDIVVNQVKYSVTSNRITPCFCFIVIGFHWFHLRLGGSPRCSSRGSWAAVEPNGQGPHQRLAQRARSNTPITHIPTGTTHHKNIAQNKTQKQKDTVQYFCPLRQAC